MRDKKRIKKILDELDKLWSKYPDLRLGQLIVNVFQNPTRLYYVEDEELMSIITEFYSEK